MKFCSNCGNQVTLQIPEGDNRLRFVCNHCNTVHYQNPLVIVGVVPEYKQNILLCKRAIEPQKGRWTLPAGFLENDESTLDGALRECFEEANAKVIDPTLYALYDIPYINQVYVFYRAQLKNEQFGPSLESTEVALFNEEDIPWDELAFPVVKAVLKRFLSDRNNNHYDVIHDVITRPSKQP
jgi:ADP-ribose pyrophosphatase YjhB (NUDIX family)